MATLSTPDSDRAQIEAFQRDVIDASMQVLVILDFTAEWCGPCKQVAPVLAKVAADYAERGVKLVKIDVDQNQAIAAQFRVQSIPTIYAIFQGQPVADLTQARTEAQFKQFLDQILPQLPLGGAEPPVAERLAAMKAEATAAAAAGEHETALQIWSALLQQEPDNEVYSAGAAVSLIGIGNLEQARMLLANIPETSTAPEIAQARSALKLAENAPKAGELEALAAKVEAAPADHAARMAYADALAAAGRGEAAAEAYLESIRRDAGHDEGAARRKLLELFEASGLDAPWVLAARRKLSALLFA